MRSFVVMLLHMLLYCWPRRKARPRKHAVAQSVKVRKPHNLIEIRPSTTLHHSPASLALRKATMLYHPKMLKRRWLSTCDKRSEFKGDFVRKWRVFTARPSRIAAAHLEEDEDHEDAVVAVPHCSVEPDAIVIVPGDQ